MKHFPILLCALLVCVSVSSSTLVPDDKAGEKMSNTKSLNGKEDLSSAQQKNSTGISSQSGAKLREGDVTIIDGMLSFVFKVDEETGRATVFTLAARTEKDLEKLKKKVEKHYDKEIKNNNATTEDKDRILSCLDASKQIPFVGIEQAKGDKRIYLVEEWAKSVPDGWRLPTTEDVESLAKYISWGLGKDNGMSNWVGKIKEKTDDFIMMPELVYIFWDGILISDDGKDLKCLQRKTVKEWMNIKDVITIGDKYAGKVRTVAVKTI